MLISILLIALFSPIYTNSLDWAHHSFTGGKYQLKDDTNIPGVVTCVGLCPLPAPSCVDEPEICWNRSKTSVAVRFTPRCCNTSPAFSELVRSTACSFLMADPAVSETRSTGDLNRGNRYLGTSNSPSFSNNRCLSGTSPKEAFTSSGDNNLWLTAVSNPLSDRDFKVSGQSWNTRAHCLALKFFQLPLLPSRSHYRWCLRNVITMLVNDVVYGQRTVD